MRLMRFLLVPFLFLGLASCSTPVTELSYLTNMPSPVIPTILATPTMTEIAYADIFALNARLGRGVNLGNALEAPAEGEWGVTLTEEYFDRIREVGFDSVRLPVRFSAHADPNPPYTISPDFLARVDWAVREALERRLAIVIDFHHYEEMMIWPRQHRARFEAIWEQLAEHYRDYPSEVMFELLNEPNGELTASLWNEILAETLTIIRRTNPTRAVIVGPVNWDGYDSLPALELPQEDHNLIVTFHYYLPFHFTHQGAEWVEGSNDWLGTSWEGTPEEQEAIRAHFEQVAAWSRRNQRPIFLGEFGAYSQADMAWRVRWTSYVARQAEAHGFSWAYWEFCSGFGVYDPQARAWREGLLQALLPPAP